jgi:hypothetical protein
MSSRQVKQMTTVGVQEIDSPSNKELDDANLARMGKRPVLKVRAPCIPPVSHWIDFTC